MPKQQITLHEGHAAINVKVYHLHTPEQYTEQDSERAWGFTVDQFWEQATWLAHEHGYSGVFAEGRSGGWLVPYLWSKPGVKHTYQGRYSQGPEAGYPRWPVMEDSADRGVFLKFQRAILRLLGNVQQDYETALEQVSILD